ncbi:hypothetical protein, partial [Bacillus cereus group sp. BC229]|uniref:hypothetical protein n=1 Tax=Bacillus cereus group sp. BC229 TaxID=3445340 RepID=UPI003F21A7E2
ASSGGNTFATAPPSFSCDGSLPSKAAVQASKSTPEHIELPQQERVTVVPQKNDAVEGVAANADVLHAIFGVSDSE